MKTKNVIFTAIATLLSIALFSVNVSADSTEGIGIEPQDSLSEKELDNLKAKGFPESVIDDYLFLGHSYQEIQELEFMGAVDKYYKLTETYPADYEEPSDSILYNDINQYDFLNKYTDDDLFSVLEEISYEDFVTGSNEEEDTKINTAANMETTTSYKRMSTTLSKINNSRYKVSNAVTWSKTPKHRKNDIIGIGINSNTSPVPGTEYGRQFWSTMTGASTGEAIYTSASNKWNRDMDYGLYFKLKSNDANKAPWTTIKMSMEYEITPNVTNITKVDAFGHYSHQESYVNYIPSFDLLSGTLSISADISNKFSHHPKTHVQINN